MHSLKCNFARIAFAFVLLTVGFGATVLPAQTSTFRVFVDVDPAASPATGCTRATTLGTSLSGIDQIVTVTVNAAGPSPSISTTSREQCPGGTVAATAALGSLPGGLSIIETSVPLGSLPTADGVRVYFDSTATITPSPNMDELVTLTGATLPAGPPIIVRLIAGDIPTLGEWGLILLAVLLALSAFVTMRRCGGGRRAAAGLFLVVFALGAGVAWAAFVVDGNPNDWSSGSGVTVAMDQDMDAQPNADIVKGYGVIDVDSSTLFLRMDVRFGAAVGTNTAPVVNPATFSIAENSANGTNVGTVTVTDPDVGQAHTFAITAGNLGGAFAINAATGQITVASMTALDFETTPTFSLTVQATDNGTPVLSGTATITVNLTNVNEAPVVQSDTFVVGEDAAVGANVGTVAFTDSDLGQTHTFSITAGNTGGAFAINPSTGQITVAAPLNASTNPTYSLTVQVTDNGTPALSGTATITVNVTDVNHTPMVTPATFSLAENSPNATSVGTVTFTDSDLGQTHTFSITAGNTGGAFAINPSTGEITVANASAVDFETNPTFSLTVQVTDNGTPALSGTATITVNLTDVNEAPVANAQSVTTPEDTPLVITLTGSDDDGDPLTFAVGTGPTNGTLSAITPINATSAQVTYTPGTDFNGADSFTFTVNDGTSTSPAATVSITVSGGNDTPVANAQSVTTPEDTPLVITLTGSDADSDPLTFAVGTGPTNGTLSAITPINATSAQVTYTPGANFNGSDSFTFTVNDGTSTSPAATVSITVSATNDAPVANAQSVTTPEDTPLVITLTGSDGDGDPLTFAVGTGPTNGTLSAITPINATSAQVTYTPGANFNGSDSFTFTVNDGTSTSPAVTVSISVTGANDIPVANAQSVTTPEDMPLVITLTGSDGDGDPLTFAIGTGPTNGTLSAITPINATSAQVTYTPGANFNGADSFTFTVNDGTATSPAATVSISVTGANDIPVANAQSVTTPEDTPLVITLTGSDADSDPLTFAVGTGPTNGTLSAITPINATSAQVTYTPGANFNGADSFTFTVNDGTSTSPAAAVSITVTSVNDNPVANAQSVTTPEDTPLVITLTGSDADGNPLTFAVGTGPTNGTLSAITPINATSAQVTYTPGTNFNGADSFTFTANDGTATSPAATVSITVNATNDTPLANAQSVSTNEDTPLVITLTGSDADGDPLTFAVGASPANGTLSAITPINATSAQVTYTPGSNFNGADSFTFTVNDGTATSPVATVSIAVNAVNDTPVANAQSVTTNEDTPLVITLTGSDTDGDSLIFAGGTGPTNGTLSAITPINATSAQVTYTPGSNFNGADSFTFTVNDGTVSSPAATVSITVNAVNDPPTANPDVANITEEAPNVAALNTVSGNVLTNDLDPDSSLTVSAVAGGSVGSPRAGSYGSVTINSNGSFTYSLDDNNPLVNALAPGGTLTESFGYTASDGSLTSSSTLMVTIHGADDPATPDNDAHDFIGNTQLEVDRDTADTPEVIANTPVNPPALGVLDGDVDPDGGSAITIAGIVGCGDLTAPFDCVLPGQGTVSLQADGSFSFVPEPGDLDPTASFQYTLVGNPVPATVTLTRFERVWFVDPTAAAGGNGTSALPFNSLDSLDGAGGASDSDSASDYIFVHDGTLALSGPMEMEANQHLIGEGNVNTGPAAGFALSIPVNLNGNGSPTNLVGTGTQPELTNSTGNAVTVGNSVPIEIVGLSLASTTGNAIDLTSTAALTGSGTLAIDDNEIRGAGAEGVDINLNAGTTGTLAVNFTNNTWDLAGTHTGNGFDARTAAAGANLRVNFSNNTNVLATGVGASGVVIDGSGGGTLTLTGFANNSVHQNTMGSGVLITSATFDADPATAGFQQVTGGTTVIGAPGPTNGVGGSGINMSTVSGDLAFTDLDVFADGGQGLRIAGTGAVNVGAGTGTRVTVGIGVAMFEATGGPAVDVNNATVDLQPTTIRSTNSTSTGVSLVNVSDGTTPSVFSAGSGSTITTAAGASGPAFNVNGGNADISYAGSITNNSVSARAVSLATWSGDDLNDDITLSGAIDENGAGILVNGTGGACAGDTDGCPITFSGGMDIDTTTGEGFAATSNGGSVRLHVTGTNTIDSISAAALRVTSTTIGNSNLNFQRISAGNNTAAADPANGIVLSNTGSSGGLIVTGNGGACTEGSSTCTGGWIQNMTGGDDSGATPGGTGIVLNNTANVSLTRMRINDTSNYGIRGTNVSGFTFTNSVVDGANGTNVSTPFNEGSLVFFGVTGTSSGITGTSSITNSTIMGGRQRNIAIDNSVGTLNLTLNGNTIKRTSDAAGDDGFFLEADTTANVTLAITNNTFARHGGDHINVTMLNNAVVGLTITGNTLHGNYAGTPEGNHPIGLSQGIFVFGATFNGTCTYNISNNGSVGVPFRGNRQVGAIHVNKGSGTGTFSGRIENNIIGDPALTGSGSSEAFGIIVGARGAGGAHTTLINNNQIRQYFDRGIVLEAGEGSAALNATVTNNTVSNFADAVNSLHGIHSDNGILAADDNAVCLQISGNSVATAGNEPAGGADIRLRRGSNTTVRLPGVAGATNANATTLLQSNNPTATTITVTGNGFSSGAACPLP